MKKAVLIPILTILVAAGLLFGLNALTATARTDARVAEHERILTTLLPGNDGFTLESYTGEDENILAIHKSSNGYVVTTRLFGYADEIEMMVGVTGEGKVVGLTVRDMHETYGLGMEALTDADFLYQFLLTTGDAEIGSGIDAISGATVTSRAIARGVNSAVAFVTGADVSSEATSWGG